MFRAIGKETCAIKISAVSRGDGLKFFPPGSGAFLRQRLAELFGVALFVAGALLLAALMTFDPADPSLNHATDRAPGNILGAGGAIVSDFALQGLGAASFALPPLLFVWAWVLLLLRRRLPRWRWRVLALVPLFWLASVALAGLGKPESWPLVSGPGGALGGLSLGLLLQLSFLQPVGMLLAPVAGLLAAIGFAWLLGLDGQQWRSLGRSIAWLFLGARRSLGLGLGVGLGRLGRLCNRDDQARQEPVFEAAAGRAARVPDEQSAPAVPPTPPLVAPRPPAMPKRKARKAPQPQPQLDFGDLIGGSAYQPPPLDLLAQPKPGERNVGSSSASLEMNARLLEGVLQDFGVRGEIVKIRPGPVVTRYDLEPAPGTKTSRVVGLADDIARSMAAISVRVAVVPGSSVIGIELPNAQREMVYLGELLGARDFTEGSAKLPLVLGKDIGGQPVIADLARMPHLLVAGTTGSGKSVAINAMINSLLYRHGPDQCRFILVDPKMLELSVYEGIPHLLAPVVTEPKKAVVALKWTVREMEERYRAMSRLGVRNVEGYNARIREALKKGEVLTRRVQTGFDPDTGQPIVEEQPFDLEPLPFIVVVVDEMADLMLVAGKDVEAAIQRLAQMARAAGIHLIMATQRPSVDVITGTIKANFPTRISFHVTSKIDSRTILGEGGAEQLLGMGDMLHLGSGGRLSRVHGPFVSDQEVEDVVAHLKALGPADFIEEITEGSGGEDDDGGFMLETEDSGDELFDRAVAIVAQHRKASTSFIQRQLQIGYNRAARIIEEMERQGMVGPANHVGKREVLLPNHGSED